MPSLQRSLRSLVVEDLSRARILDAFNIDYYCHGERSLEEACQVHGVEPDAVLEALEDAKIRILPFMPDWDRASNAFVVRHVMETHHAFLRRELPRVAGLVDKLEAAHGGARPEQAELIRAFRHFKTRIEAAMVHEESLLFMPILAGKSDGLPLLPEDVQEHEAADDEAMEELRRIRDLTRGFRVPETACWTEREILERLCAIEADMHLHLHKEHNLLFPRLIATPAGTERS